MNIRSLASVYDFELDVNYYDALDINEQDELFRFQFLKAFHLDTYTDHVVVIIEKIYECVKENAHIIRWLNPASKANNIEKPHDCSDGLHGFMMLFTYDRYQFLHCALQSLFRKGVIEEDIVNELDNRLK